MCCTNDARAVKRLRARMEKAGGKMQFYKVYKREGNRLHSIIYSRSPGGILEGSGIVKSNARLSPIAAKDGATIQRGIHVFLRKRDAENLAMPSETIVSVSVNVKRLMATDGSVAVFGQVCVTPQSWARAMKRTKGSPHA